MGSDASPPTTGLKGKPRVQPIRTTRAKAAKDTKKRVANEEESESDAPPNKKARQTQKTPVKKSKPAKTTPKSGKAASKVESKKTSAGKTSDDSARKASRLSAGFSSRDEDIKIPTRRVSEVRETDTVFFLTSDRPNEIPRPKANTHQSKEKAADKGDDGDETAKPKAKRKTKAEKEADMQPLAARTIGSKVLVGAHVSASGGPHKSIMNSVHIGGNAFALFLKSQRKWANPAMKMDDCRAFQAHCREHAHTKTKSGHLPVLPHGSYLVNLAHPDADRKKQAYDSFLDDLDRCHQLGIGLYNFHPGNSASNPSREDGLKCIADNLNEAHADPKSGKVVTLLETMAAFGSNTIGATFEDLAETIALVDDKDRVGVCLDTCHIFAAGYDIRNTEAYKKTMDGFDKVIGLKYLKALHMNDSKAPLSSGRDLHANIGTGFIGLRGFWNVMNDERLWGLPLILETPTDGKKDDKGKAIEDKGTWVREIKLLESLVGMDVDGDEFRELEASLSKEGEAERKRIQEQVDKRKEKKTTGAKKGKKGGKKGKDESDEEESEED